MTKSGPQTLVVSYLSIVLTGNMSDDRTQVVRTTLVKRGRQVCRGVPLSSSGKDPALQTAPKASTHAGRRGFATPIDWAGRRQRQFPRVGACLPRVLIGSLKVPGQDLSTDISPCGPAGTSMDVVHWLAISSLQTLFSTSDGIRSIVPKGSMPIAASRSSKSLRTSSLLSDHVDAKQRQKVQPARSSTRWRVMSAGQRSGPWKSSPSHSMARRMSLAPSTTKSIRKAPAFTCGTTR